MKYWRIAGVLMFVGLPTAAGLTTLPSSEGEREDAPVEQPAGPTKQTPERKKFCTHIDSLDVVRADVLSIEVDGTMRTMDVLMSRDGKSYSRPLSPFVNPDCVTEVTK